MQKITKHEIIDMIEYAPYFYIAAIFFFLAMVFASLSLYEMEKTVHETTDYAIITGITANNLANQAGYYMLVAVVSVFCGLITRMYTWYWMRNYNHIIKTYGLDVIE